MSQKEEPSRILKYLYLGMKSLGNVVLCCQHAQNSLTVSLMDCDIVVLMHYHLTIVGGKVHAKDKELLQKLNITHVVNCSPSRRYRCCMLFFVIYPGPYMPLLVHATSI